MSILRSIVQTVTQLCVWKEKKEKYTLFRDHNGSLLRRQLGALCVWASQVCGLQRVTTVCFGNVNKNGRHVVADAVKGPS